jgi:ATP/ADP translocase
MRNAIRRWLDVHEDEIGLFMWTVLLLFLVRSSGIFLNNYAETAFLKRYGVEYMPIVNMINAVVTFIVMGLLAGVMARLPGARLLARLFVFCALSVAFIRAIIPFGIDLVYPALFMLKSQYEVLLALLFWNLANDLFNTRQSKRLFPLITAGGVIGQILGSFATPLVARWLHLDNLLLVYTATALAGAWAVLAMGKRYPTLLFQQKETSARHGRPSMIEEFKSVWPLMRSSFLVKILVVVTLMSNVVVPIMNYQFNFAVNEQFATESGLIMFFGYFRGVLNTVSLVILLFVGKLYDRFGLPVALMFHPFNYLLVFLAFLFRFDAVAAIYARMSSNIIRTTINIPATAVVTGLFPESYRAMVRPFLRGTVVRIGLFAGSGLILLSDNLFHPRYLSLVAMPFVLVWLMAPFILKRRYAGVLLELIAEDRIDFRSLDADELGQLFRDRRIQATLVDRFERSSGQERLWYAQLLKSIQIEDLDAHLLTALSEEQDGPTCIGLIGLLSNQAGPPALETFNRLVENASPDLVIAVIDAGHRISAHLFAPLHRNIVESSLPLAVKAHAMGSLFRVDAQRYGPAIEAWLMSDDGDERQAGVVAAGICRDPRFSDRLKTLLATCDDHATQILVLDSLRAGDAAGLNPQLVPRLSDPDPLMRRAALENFRIVDEASLKQAITLLGDASDAVSGLAREKIGNAVYQNGLRLIKSLSLPQQKIREALFELLEEMSIKDLVVFQFVQIQAKSCYQLMLQGREIERLGSTGIHRLLADHLQERVWFTLQTILRVLAAHDRTGRMNTIAATIFSADARQRANSLEAMDDILDKRLVRLLTPLLDDMDHPERIARGRRLFPHELAPPTSPALLDSLLASRNWVTVVLTLVLIDQAALDVGDADRLQALVENDNDHVSRAAAALLDGMRPRAARPEPSQELSMETVDTIPLTDKIVHLKNIEIFGDLSVNELAAIAAATRESVFDVDEIVFKEGETGDTLFFVVEGSVAVIKDRSSGTAIELDRIDAGDYFGEMALFGDDSRSATIRVTQAARFLTLHKHELQEIVREFPQIALHVCRVLSTRIRHLHSKISEHTC